ncbi:MAG TPA: MerR family transcriptional regulator [Candidatus Limnocylindria bacterium]|nr:MerR family transcriptional regulator [Candidatus Limnocylindria bacterium]
MTVPDATRGATRTYRIGEAARRVGVSPSALRLWERQGLVRPRRGGSRYRIYTDGDLQQLHSIRRLRTVDRLNAPGIRRVLGSTVGAADAEGRGNGRPLRRIREELGLSLREASERSGLSTSFLSALERGMSGASVATLQRLTAVYGTTLHELFGASDDEAPHRLVRAGERRALRLGNADVRIEELARTTRQLEPQLFILAPGATSDGAYAHEGEEFLYLLSGAVTVWVGEDECYALDREGDALTFPSTLPHRWRNDARGESRLLWINTPPTF